MEKLNNNLNCRFCGHSLDYDFIDLGVSPLSNSYLTENDLQKVERFYPLHAFVCNNCFLVQLGEYGNPQEIFSDYAYFSSYSTSWLEHAKKYTNSMIGKFGFDKNSKVIEIASNDGYLLQYFKAKGINVLGIEPASNVAKVAVEKGIPTREIFLNSSTGAQLYNE
ncbi:MAG: SAM-dependent methyltransferase, partial [Fidelibacterota bacterium]